MRSSAIAVAAAALAAAGCAAHDSAELEVDVVGRQLLAHPVAVGVQISKDNRGGPAREVRLRPGTNPALTYRGRGRYYVAVLMHDCPRACAAPIRLSAADVIRGSCTRHLRLSRNERVRLAIVVEPRQSRCRVSVWR